MGLIEGTGYATSKEENIAYFIKSKNLKRVENYLGGNSAEYAFSGKKGEKRSVCFIDKEKRIFAILNIGKKEVEFSQHITENSEIINGIEKILFSGGRS